MELNRQKSAIFWVAVILTAVFSFFLGYSASENQTLCAYDSNLQHICIQQNPNGDTYFVKGL